MCFPQSQQNNITATVKEELLHATCKISSGLLNYTSTLPLLKKHKHQWRGRYSPSGVSASDEPWSFKTVC